MYEHMTHLCPSKLILSYVRKNSEILQEFMEGLSHILQDHQIKQNQRECTVINTILT